MIKTVVIILIVFAGSICIGWYFRKCHIKDEIREQKFQREMARCDRVIEENRRLLELINYNGDDWTERWEEYMMEKMLFEEHGPV